MKTISSKLLDEAFKLPPTARAAMAGALLKSLDEPVDEDAEAAWDVEIARRLRELDSGKAKLVPWSQVRRQLMGRIRARRKR